MPNTDTLHSAVNATLGAAAQLQAEWLRLLPPDKLAKLEDLVKHEVSIAVQVITAMPPRLQFVGIDVKGGMVILEEVQITISAAARH